MGGGNFWGYGQQQGGGGFGHGRGQVICYNCGQPGNFSHDSQSPSKMCTYCKSFYHTVEQCLQLIVKWKAQTIVNPNLVQNQNLNPNQKIHMIYVKLRETRIVVVTRGGIVIGIY